MKRLVLIGMLMLLAAGVQARKWTSADGKTVEADLIRVKNGKVYLQVLRTRKIHAFDISKLSQEDQEYIAEYQKEAARKEAAAKDEAARAKRKAKWHDDLEDALEESKELNLPIFILFTAPDWCQPCRKLEDDILDQKAFRIFANMNLVLHEVDCSNRSELPKWKKENPEMAAKCEVPGFPTAYLIGADGSVLGRFGASNASPEEYADSIRAKIK